MKNKISIGMKKYTNKIYKSVLFILLAVVVGISAVYATDLITNTLTPTVAPQKTMKSLSDLYTLVTTGQEPSTPSSVYQAPTGTPTITENSPSILNIYNKTKDEIAKLSSSVIASGTSVFGIDGELEAGTNFGIPKTGQTICNQFSDNYNSANQVPCAGTNQDGDLQKGIALSYTDNGDGTVKDNTTGLTWQKCADGQDPLTCAGTANTFLMDDGNGVSPAINYCESLSLATNTDWHLPNVKQLQSIVDYGRVSPAINPDYFPNTSSGNYWSSTAYLSFTWYAWYVGFNEGNVFYDGMGGAMGGNFYVRCVRE